MRTLGDHRDTATALTTLASMLLMRGKLPEAREALEESLTMRCKVFAPDSAAIGNSPSRLGNLENEAGNLELAERLLREGLAN